MNLDEYITNFEKGNFSFQEIEKFAQNQSIDTIFRLYCSYGESKKIGFYDHDSLRWILSCLKRELEFAGFEQAANLLEIDANASFSCFFSRFETLNQNSLLNKRNNSVEIIKL